MVWTFGMMALRKADIGEFFAEFVRFTIFTGFFWWLLTNGPNFASSIYASLRQIAGNATGLGQALSPSGIVDMGFAIFYKVMDQSSVWSPVDSMAGILMAVAILVILALVGVNMLLLLASGWVLAYGGVFFLGFGGSRWTSDMAINYYKTVLGVAAQLLAMVLLVGIGKTFLDDYYSRMSAGISLKEMGVMLIVCVILLGTGQQDSAAHRRDHHRRERGRCRHRQLRRRRGPRCRWHGGRSGGDRRRCSGRRRSLGRRWCLCRHGRLLEGQ
jgi:type IV secretion system protein TrbL